MADASTVKLMKISDILEAGQTIEYSECFVLGFFTEYNPAAGTAKLLSPEGPMRGKEFVRLDLSGVPFHKMAVEGQLCRVIGKCSWNDGEVTIHVQSMKTVVNWDCPVFNDIMEKQRVFMGQCNAKT